jgi:hypothetical protein
MSPRRTCLAFAATFGVALIVALVANGFAQSPEETPSTPTLTVLYKFGTNTNDPMNLVRQLAIAQGRDGK